MKCLLGLPALVLLALTATVSVAAENEPVRLEIAVAALVRPEKIGEANYQELAEKAVLSAIERAVVYRDSLNKKWPACAFSLISVTQDPSSLRQGLPAPGSAAAPPPRPAPGNQTVSSLPTGPGASAQSVTLKATYLGAANCLNTP